MNIISLANNIVGRITGSNTHCQVTIELVNDEPPQLVRNDEIQVEIGETRFISSRSLLSTDRDTEADQLLYIVKQLPDHGELILTRSGREDKILRENEHFTQNDGK